MMYSVKFSYDSIIKFSDLFSNNKHMSYTWFGRNIIYLVLILISTGCNKEREWQLNDVTGHLPDLQFSLMSDSGQEVTEQTYRGYQVMMFFGFTNCVSECPATMFRLAKIVKILGQEAERTRILFVTLEPERDTSQVLHRYVAAFDADHAIGLTGKTDDIEALVKRYRAAYRPRKSDGDDIVHSIAVYVFDSEGHARLLMTPDDTIETVAHDLRQLQASAPGP